MFNESSTVEELIINAISGHDSMSATFSVNADKVSNASWRYVPTDELARTTSDVLIEGMLCEALIRMNPEISVQPDRAEEVIHRLRAIIQGVQSDGLVRSNEHFTEWLRGAKTMPFGENNEHTSVKLIDFDHLENNQYIVTNQWSYPAKDGGKRLDKNIKMLQRSESQTASAARTRPF